MRQTPSRTRIILGLTWFYYTKQDMSFFFMTTWMSRHQKSKFIPQDLNEASKDGIALASADLHANNWHLGQDR